VPSVKPFLQDKAFPTERNKDMPNDILPGAGSANSERLDADHIFRFRCAPGISCFTECCGDVVIALTPYDVLRLKNALGLPSQDFLDSYTIIIPKEKKLIPLVLLKMGESDKRCPFVTVEGCTVYEHRPWPCRMFPLDVNDDGTFSIISGAKRCRGVEENEGRRVSDWLIEQGVPVYDEMNSLLGEITSPLRAQEPDIDNPQVLKMVFMALYNLDKFKEFVFKSSFLEKFDVEKTRIEKISRSDIELLKFAVDWIKFGVFGQKLFQVK
jgi:uncharacterized protein